MSAPLHLTAAIPVAASATELHRLLSEGGAELVNTATAVALTHVAPHLRSWGTQITMLPTVVTDPSNDGALGSLHVRWAGSEDASAWPALQASLVVTPTGADTSRLTLVTPRSPRAELRTARLGGAHRRRVTSTTLRTFLQRLRVDLGLGCPDLAPDGAAGRDDDGPRFLHGMMHVPWAAETLRRALHVDPTHLVEEATSEAAARLAPVLAAGRFRAPAQPAVECVGAGLGRFASLDLRWRSDEEASGWPAGTLEVVIAASATGSTLAVLAAHPAGYDLSVNRVDKQHRDRLQREAGPWFLDALADRLAPSVALPPQQAVPV